MPGLKVVLPDGTTHDLNGTSAGMVAWLVLYGDRVNRVTAGTLELNWRPGVMEAKLREAFPKMNISEAA